MKKCEKITANSLESAMPEPPMAIQGLLDDYQDFLGSVFAREYEVQRANPVGTNPMYMPKLSNEEKQYIENLTTTLRNSPEWKDYVSQCRRWAIMM